MRLTTKGRFAVAAMLDMAEAASNRPINLAVLSQRQNVSLSYLEALFSRLRRHELVASSPSTGRYRQRRRPNVGPRPALTG